MLENASCDGGDGSPPVCTCDDGYVEDEMEGICLIGKLFA